MKILSFFPVSLLLVSSNGFACSVCFGNPNSLESRGVLYGVLFLLAVIVSVLTGIVAFWISAARRSRKIPLSL